MCAKNETGQSNVIKAFRRPRQKSASAMLKFSIKTIGADESWKLIKDRWPTIEPVTLNLSKYLTELVPGVNTKGPLLDACVENAIAGWFKAVSKGQGERDCYIKYIRGLLYPLPEALEWRVCFDRSGAGSVWDPFEETVLKWRKNYDAVPGVDMRERPKDSAYINVSPADFRFLVLVKFLAPGSMNTSSLAAYFDQIVSRYG